MVSTLKAKIEKGAELTEEVDFVRVAAVKKYLKEYYGLDDSDVEAIGNRITLYVSDNGKEETLSFNAVSDFDITDGKAVPKRALPEINGTKQEKDAKEIENGGKTEENPIRSSADEDRLEAHREDPASSGLTEDEIIAKCMQLFSLTEDEFWDALLEIPNSAVKDIRFNDDGSISVKGIKYNLREMVERIKAEEAEDA